MNHGKKASRWRQPQVGFLVLLAAALPLRADVAMKADKSQFTLFDPTPKELLRELSTDRPDKTESAYSVDAGHFQVEMDVISYTHDRDTSNSGDIRTETYDFAVMNLKVGLLNDLDFQLVVPTYTRERVTDHNAGVSTTKRGFGDLTARVKWNLWGNDGGATALSAMPFVKFPTASEALGNDSVEGGIIFPFAIELPYGWYTAMMTEFDIMRDASGSGNHVEFINSITVGHQIIGELWGYIEFFSLVSTETGSEWIGTFDAGLTYGLTENVQLDMGVNVGVTDAADDLNLFSGISFRF